VEWHNQDEEYLDQMSEMTHYYVPDLMDDWRHKPVAWIDAVRLPISNKWSRPRERREDQSGEKKLTLRKCILLSDPRGKIVAVVINIPGSWGDSKGTRLGGLYDMIDALLEGYNVVSDTAFTGHLLTAKIIKVLKEAQRIPDGMTDEDVVELEKLITRARQPAEWINRDFVASFRKLRQILGIHDDINSKVMLASILIQNWRVSTCDRNQVKKFFQILKEKATCEAEMSENDL
jgi:DDE superfamily endonuclease